MNLNLIKKPTYSINSYINQKDIEKQGIQYDFLSNKLKQILQTLTIQKKFMQGKIQRQREIFNGQMQAKQQLIRDLEQQKIELRKQMQSEKQKNKCQVAYLKMKNNKIQLQRDSLANIIHYLQLKNKQLTEQIYQLKKNKNRRLTQPNNNLYDLLSPNYYERQRQTLFQNADFSSKLILPQNICRTESSQVSLAVNNKYEESESITVQKRAINTEKKGSLHAFERIRSYGQIDETTRDTVMKVEKIVVKNPKDKACKKQQNKREKQFQKTEVIPKKMKRFDST